MQNIKENIGIIGLGYVGLPLCISLAKSYKVFGYDLNKKRINDLKKKIDITNEIKKTRFLTKNKIFFSSDINALKTCTVIIVTVPTPIFENSKLPDLSHLSSACKKLSKIIQKGCIVIFESTVYPGVTEEFCARIIEKKTKLKLNRDFYCGYSPERINPGDRINTIDKITKIISASHPKVINRIKLIYQKVTKSIYVAKNIKTAEAAKVIENTQRDINIALTNELSLIFKKNKINIFDVLKAAGTKWNFHQYEPGFVGGHCIGVDPYYLTYYAKKTQINPKVILSGRKINDSMPKYFFKLCEHEIQKKIKKQKKNILFMGLTFKENCPDTRNSQALQILKFFKDNKKKYNVISFDPYCTGNIQLNSIKETKLMKYKNYFDVLILITPHQKILKIQKKIVSLLKKNNIIFDPKNKLKEFSNKITL